MRVGRYFVMAGLSCVGLLLIISVWLVSLQPPVEAKKGPLVTDIVSNI